MCSPTAAMVGVQVLKGYKDAKQINDQYVAQRRMYEAQERAVRQNSEIVKKANERVAENYARDQKKLNDRLKLVRGQQAAAAGASGISGNSGSLLDAASAANDEWRDASFDLLRKQREDTWANFVQAANYDAQANIYDSLEEQNKAARKKAMLGSIIGSAFSIYGAATGQSLANTVSGLFGGGTNNNSNTGGFYTATPNGTISLYGTNTNNYGTSIGGSTLYGSTGIYDNRNGSTTEFPYTFQIIDPTDIKVYIVNPEGVETLITSDYYVDMSQQEVHYPGYAPGAAEPGSETPPILPVGWKIILYRQLPIDQQSVLDNNWPFKEIEHMVDKSRIIEQQLAGDLKRALKISLQFPNLDITVPVGANKSLRWNSDGTKLELTVDPADVLPVAQSLLAATQAARDALLMRPGYLAVESSIDKIDTIAADLTNLDNVADNIAVIAPVGAAIDQVEEVADDLAKINGVHDNLNNINAVYSIKDDISAVAEISLDVSNVSTIKTDIQSVATNIDNIINVAGNLAPVKIVGDNINSILTVNSNLPNINVVANNKANIDNVATNITGVNTVATNMNNVLVVANSKANIDAVALNKTNIDTIATNLTSIQAVVSNLPAILAALDYALLAKQWAIGDPTEPEDGSAKYWAFQSHADQMQADWDVTDPTDVRYIKNKPAKLPEDHSDVTTKYGGGTNEKYGHVRLLDNIIHAWATPASFPVAYCKGITYGNNKFVAVGANGMITTSNDGILWSEPVQVSTNQWQCVTYGNNKFVAVANGGLSATSIDGINWTIHSYYSTPNRKGISYGNNRFVVVGQDAWLGKASVFYSSDGTTWTNGNVSRIEGVGLEAMANGLALYAQFKARHDDEEDRTAIINAMDVYNRGRYNIMYNKDTGLMHTAGE
ncbi:unnamed protein product, partial [Cylicocyclus nassatus]